ncbi:MAG TPA: shikimate kinase [Cyclobacteriaceae bacterium]|nr:shikimate kinase [Cyclobacteriaceae bacterium]
MKVFLLGLPGSGKTTLGKKLASALQLPFVDLDKEIERTEGKPISEIFSEKKEDYFRKLESSQLKLWCAKPGDFVMATGGGAPCFFDNITVINQSGKSIFLDVPASEIVKRMSRAGVEKRPLLAAGGRDGLKDHIEFMRSNRISFYKQATYTFSGLAINVQEMVAALRK